MSRNHFKTYLLTAFGWIAATLLFVLIRFFGLASVPQFKGLDPGQINQLALLLQGVVVGWVLGTLFYVLDRALDRPAIRQLPYGALMLIQAAGNLGLVVVALVSVSLIEMARQGQGFEMASLLNRVLSANFLVVAIYLTAVSFLFSFLRQVNGKFGPGNLWRLIIGMYHHPREEERIFMFLDLKGSTAHAERLGHVKFSRLIQDCFIDLSVVIDHQAQVYQYVGDEVILFWDVAAGLGNARCIRAFFKFTDRLESRAGYYQSEYGVLPAFKAGIHIGSAMVLEVGEIKREISYLGDLLNTAARIQGECNRLGESLLISEALHLRLGEIPADLSTKLIGAIELKGKMQAVNILSVHREGAKCRDSQLS